MTTSAPTRKQLTGADLYGLIDDLAPLWDQLLGNTARPAGSGFAVPRSRPPVSTEVLSLIGEIRGACERRLRSAGRQPIVRTRILSDGERERVHARPDSTVIESWRDIPAELRAINVITKDRPIEQAGWAERATEWVHRAQVALGLVEPRIQLPRGTRCLDCGKAWVERVEDGEVIKHPAVHLVWHPSGALHYVACSACGSSRWPADLHALAERQADLNLEHHTMEHHTMSDHDTLSDADHDDATSTAS